MEEATSEDKANGMSYGPKTLRQPVEKTHDRDCIGPHLPSKCYSFMTNCKLLSPPRTNACTQNSLPSAPPYTVYRLQYSTIPSNKRHLSSTVCSLFTYDSNTSVVVIQSGDPMVPASTSLHGIETRLAWHRQSSPSLAVDEMGHIHHERKDVATIDLSLTEIANIAADRDKRLA